MLRELLKLFGLVKRKDLTDTITHVEVYHFERDHYFRNKDALGHLGTLLFVADKLFQFSPVSSFTIVLYPPLRMGVAANDHIEKIESILDNYTPTGVKKEVGDGEIVITNLIDWDGFKWK